MSTASAFSLNKKEVELPPIQPAQNLEKVELKIPDVGQSPAVKTPTPASVYDSASLAGNNLRNDYKTPDVAPKGDLNYGLAAVGDTLKDTVTGLFGALKSKEPDVAGPQQPGLEQPQVAMTTHRPAVFGM